jgi:polar amino acid transport system substrate-binding protein
MSAMALMLAAGACGPTRERTSRAATTTTASTVTAAPTSTERPEDSVRSFEPGTVTAEAARAQLIKKDVLVAGVSADTYLKGFRNTRTGALEGFDIEMLHEIARGLFGDPDRIEYKGLTVAQRLPALEKGEVDVVAHALTITCDRWEHINFSTEYVRAGQRLMVRLDDEQRGVASLDQLARRSVCASAGGTGADNIRANHPNVTLVAAADRTDCLVKFQEGTVDAVVNGDTLLAGFVAQDPLARLVGPLLTIEPTGIGVRRENVELTRFVNKVLDGVRAGPWRAYYDKWLGPVLGAPVPPSPPRPVYGRQP